MVVTLVGIAGGLDAVWQVKRGFADELRADEWGTESAGGWRGSVGDGWTILGEALLHCCGIAG